MLKLKDIQIRREPVFGYDSTRLTASVHFASTLEQPAETRHLQAHRHMESDALEHVIRDLCRHVYHEVVLELRDITDIALGEGNDPYSFNRDTIDAISALRQKLDRPQK